MLELVAQGKVDGLRIDHPDGLFDPGQYFRRLQQAAGGALPASGDALPLYLVIENILAEHERLPDDWSVHGSTGYRFANLVNGLFVDGAAERRTTRVYQAFTGVGEDFESIAYVARKLIMRAALSSERNVLATRLARIAAASRETCDFTLNGLRVALVEVVASFPVYRSYVTGSRLSADDRRHIGWAVAVARRRNPVADPGIFDFIHGVLTTDIARGRGKSYRERVEAFAMKFQQFSSPVMAKGVEDTAFYRYHRLISLNDVGGEPRRFGVSVAAFHAAMRFRAARSSYSLLATSTHDSKRSEDVRGRVDVLSEMPAAWKLMLRRWARLNRGRKRRIDGVEAPSRNDEYLLYQTLVGSWPLAHDENALEEYRQRIDAYMIKALREAKEHSSWTNIHADYEAAMSGFVDALLAPGEKNLFLSDFMAMVRPIAHFGILNSLAQSLIKLTAPGVPDIYQGWRIVAVQPRRSRQPAAGRFRRAPGAAGPDQGLGGPAGRRMAGGAAFAARRHERWPRQALSALAKPGAAPAMAGGVPRRRLPAGRGDWHRGGARLRLRAPRRREDRPGRRAAPRRPPAGEPASAAAGAGGLGRHGAGSARRAGRNVPGSTCFPEKTIRRRSASILRGFWRIFRWHCWRRSRRVISAQDAASIEECAQRSLALLHGNLGPHGFMAARPTDKAVARRYDRVFGRDAARSGDARLIRGARLSLTSLAAHQAANGQIPKFVEEDAGRGDFWYLGCIDATLWWLIAVRMVDAATGGGLEYRHRGRVRRAIAWLTAQEHPLIGLLQQNEASDWADIMPRSGFVLYTNALWLYVKKLYRLPGSVMTRRHADCLFSPGGELPEYRRLRLLVHYAQRGASPRAGTQGAGAAGARQRRSGLAFFGVVRGRQRCAARHGRPVLERGLVPVGARRPGADGFLIRLGNRMPGALEGLYPGRPLPYLGRFEPPRHRVLFNEPLHEIASVALLPLSRQGELIGSLNFGSASPDRYAGDYGTDFLERLAEVVAICLESALAKERLKRIGLTDPLTGVNNRRFFDQRCLAEISQAIRYGHPLACLLLDIDRFKRINDTYGHQTGDAVLRGVANDIQG